MSERISLARTVTERKVHLALREKLFPRGVQRQSLCASMAIAVARRNKAFQQATVGCATNAQAFLPTLSAREKKVKGIIPLQIAKAEPLRLDGNRRRKTE